MSWYRLRNSCSAPPGSRPTLTSLPPTRKSSSQLASVQPSGAPNQRCLSSGSANARNACAGVWRNRRSIVKSCWRMLIAVSLVGGEGVVEDVGEAVEVPFPDRAVLGDPLLEGAHRAGLEPAR